MAGRSGARRHSRRAPVLGRRSGRRPAPAGYRLRAHAGPPQRRPAAHAGPARALRRHAHGHTPAGPAPGRAQSRNTARSRLHRCRNRCADRRARYPRRSSLMDFEFSSDQLALRDAISRVCERFPDDYWLERDRDGGFPHDFHAALANDGWLGIAMPQEYGGAGLGMTEAALMMQTIAASGAGFAGASAVHMNIFGLNPVVVFGTDDQRRRWLEPLIAGREKACFAVTEPDAGLDTTKLSTRAERQGDEYIVHGRKIWISTAQVAHKMLLLARTTPLAEVSKPTQGLSLFYTDLDRERVEVREIEKMGRKAVDSNMLFIDGLRIPAADRIGEEGRGFEYILHGLNPERILIAAEAVGIGRAALDRAVQYAGERTVFGRPIGQ